MTETLEQLKALDGTTRREDGMLDPGNCFFTNSQWEALLDQFEQARISPRSVKKYIAASRPCTRVVTLHFGYSRTSDRFPTIRESDPVLEFHTPQGA